MTKSDLVFAQPGPDSAMRPEKMTQRSNVHRVPARDTARQGKGRGKNSLDDASAQNEPNAVPRPMTTASAMMAPTMPTITISRAFAMGRAAHGEQRHHGTVVGQAVERARSDHGDAVQ
jgi:hypothetical protein